MAEQQPVTAPASAPAPVAEAKAKKEKKPKVEDQLELSPPPSYLEERIHIFDRLYAEHLKEIEAKPKLPIKITLPDGKVLDGISWKTTPYDIAASISQGLANDVVISKVNEELFDIDRPLEGDAHIKFLKFDDPEAQQVFWHSSAHILGEALERHVGGCLCYGPPIENGFYYDTFLGEKTLTPENSEAVETITKKIIKDKQPFQRLEMTKEDLREMFKYNQFKLRIINERIDTPTTTVYRCGPLIDLCRGPHIKNTGRVKALKVTKTSSTYWEGNAEAEVLQRMYGISFPSKKELDEWVTLQEEAAKRDHRKIGREQELFFFHELSPGACFFLPHGAFIYNTLIDYIRSEYHKRGFTEVITPNMYNSKLWMTSGHWQHYAENMFSFEVEKETFALKPMNCPGHCLMFAHRNRSYRELPLRFADFGVLHRNELSGALTGLTRVRRFQQDDAHIFCRQDQIEQEIAGALDFLQAVYGTFGFTFNLNLSTRPAKYLGEESVWNRAELALTTVLNRFGHPWKLNPGDGAFYGPKIDITIMDALKRAHQCATIQLDFQLPIRFKLEFTPETTSEETSRPVIIHRAILGSVERIIAILTESYGGKWPFWLSPRQVQVIAVHPKYDAYAITVRDRLRALNFQADVDLDISNTLNKKIRNAQLDQYNFILVVGASEEQNNSVNVRTRDNVVHGERSFDELVAHFNAVRGEKRLNDNFENTPASAASKSDVASSADAVADE